MNTLSSDLLTLISIGAVQLLAVISPGPSFLVTARTAVARSRGEGARTAVGLGLGTVVWSSAALFGLDALFHAMPTVFLGMRIAGALFLLRIAFQIVRHAAEPMEMGEETSGRRGGPLLTGFLTQISNPKVAVFFGSIFISMSPSNPPLWMDAALVAIVSLNEVWWYSLVALCVGSDAVRRRYLAAKKWIDRATGLFLGALGLRMMPVFW